MTCKRTAFYGLVNMMSDAPSAQHVVRELKSYRAGSTPHVTGSSRLERPLGYRGMYEQA